jgi:hypothetical protein
LLVDVIFGVIGNFEGTATTAMGQKHPVTWRAITSCYLYFDIEKGNPS